MGNYVKTFEQFNVKGFIFAVKNTEPAYQDKVISELNDFLSDNKIGYLDGHGSGIGSGWTDMFFYVSDGKYDLIKQKFQELLDKYKAHDYYKLQENPSIHKANDIDFKYIKSFESFNG